jgi:hypothetical protein
VEYDVTLGSVRQPHHEKQEGGPHFCATTFILKILIFSKSNSELGVKHSASTRVGPDVKNGFRVQVFPTDSLKN